VSEIKSMKVFFIDNQGEWGDKATLVDGIVAWPDSGRYPAAAPLAIATHPKFDGRVVMLGGNRCLILSFIPGAKSVDDVKKALNGRGVKPVQYRIALDSIVHRLLLAGAAEGSLEGTSEGVDGVHPLSLLRWLAKTSPDESSVLAAALRAYLPQASTPAAFSHAEVMLDQLTRGE
jgi:hypothetical protein